MFRGPRQPVRFDPETLRLSIGDKSTTVADPARGNEAVLRSYLDLVAEVRGTPIGSGIEIRQDDVAVLAEILDLSDVDLVSDLSVLLGVSHARATAIHQRLRGHRALAAASIAVGGLSFLGVGKVAATPAVPATDTRPAAVVSVVHPPASDVVGHVVLPAPPVATPPPVTEAATAPHTHTHPTGPDDVQIGDALVIERGQQPDDPTTNVGDAVTYER